MKKRIALSFILCVLFSCFMGLGIVAHAAKTSNFAGYSDSHRADGYFDYTESSDKAFNMGTLTLLADNVEMTFRQGFGGTVNLNMGNIVSTNSTPISGTVNVSGTGIISGGTFSGQVNLTAGGTITGGTFTGILNIVDDTNFAPDSINLGVTYNLTNLTTDGAATVGYKPSGDYVTNVTAVAGCRIPSGSQPITVMVNGVNKSNTVTYFQASGSPTITLTIPKAELNGPVEIIGTAAGTPTPPPAPAPAPAPTPDDTPAAQPSPQPAAPQPVSYPVVQGAAQSVTDVSQGATFKVDGDFDKCSGIWIDGTAIAREYYDLERGSVILTLKPSYLATLSAGRHTVYFVFDDGGAVASFNIGGTATGKVNPNTGVTASMLNKYLQSGMRR
ncbi:MAG: hypothetical protein PHG02_09230 [Oscillospiraceae bacterium]|nr:hypothetical protein [Oscillospiraceae bacterium]